MRFINRIGYKQTISSVAPYTPFFHHFRVNIYKNLDEVNNEHY